MISSDERTPASAQEIHADGVARRVVIFTATSDLLESPWWSIISATPGIERVLLCRQVAASGRKSVIRSVRANLRKHGPLFVPYRLAAFVFERRRNVASPVRSGAGELPLEVIEAPSIHSPDVLDAVAAWRPDIGLSIGAPILKEQLFSIPEFGTVNIHCGEAPRFRGAPPGFWELMHRAEQIGATVHRIDAGLDTGSIIDQAVVPLNPTDTLRSASERAYALGEMVLERALPRLIPDPRLRGAPQPPGGATYRQPVVAKRMALGWRLRRASAKRALQPRQLAKNATAAVLLSIVRPLRDLYRTVVGGHPVRVFTFHRVTELCRDGMTVAPAVFDAQIRYLKKRHNIVSLDEATAAIVAGRPLRRPLAVIAFDDAYRSVYTHAAPILRSHGATATCFAATGLLGTGRRFEHDDDCPARDLVGVMSWDELRELRSEGWMIGSHTINHARLSACDEQLLRNEIVCSKMELDRFFGLDSVAMAYPFGGRNDISPAAREQVRAAGYVACFSDFGGDNMPGDDPLHLRRIDIGANHTTLMWKLYANGYDLGAVRERAAKVI